MKKWMIIAIIALILIAFFFPKEAGQTGRPGVQPGEQTWIDKKCSCLGYKFSWSYTSDTPLEYLCLGIPFSCKCTQNTVNQETITSKEIEC
jgi:hypothetical protein